MCGSIHGLYHANQSQQAKELNISSTATTTETEKKKRKPQGRLEDMYYTIQEYKAFSNAKKKELKDLPAYTEQP